MFGEISAALVGADPQDVLFPFIWFLFQALPVSDQFQPVESDLLLLFDDDLVPQSGVLYKLIYLWFKFSLEHSLSGGIVAYVLQPIQVQEHLVPNCLVTLFKKYIFVIGVHVVEYLTHRSCVENQVVQPRVVPVEEL